MFDALVIRNFYFIHRNYYFLVIVFDGLEIAKIFKRTWKYPYKRFLFKSTWIISILDLAVSFFYLFGKFKYGIEIIWKALLMKGFTFAKGETFSGRTKGFTSRRDVSFIRWAF